MYKIGAFENTCYCRKVVFTRHLKRGEISRNQKKLHFQKIFFLGIIRLSQEEKMRIKDDEAKNKYPFPFAHHRSFEGLLS